ncbi:MAG: histidine phosphatase family protein [Verrucomicrobia bacterium]|nr:histidine phosphatase family protein [Verrucomicrobiota bacterium]
MVSIWLIRHGQSEAQRDAGVDGRNPKLSELGQRQAKTLHGRLSQESFTRILVSPLQRAHETYRIAGLCHPCAEADSRLVEHLWGGDDYGPLLPLTPPPGLLQDRQHSYGIATEIRAQALIDELVALQDESIALFGHWGMFSRVLLCFLGADAQDWRLQPSLSNAGVSLLEIGDGGERVVRFWNDQSHLAGLATPSTDGRH